MAVNLIDNEEIHVNQDGSDITLEIQADALKNDNVVVGSIRTKNIFDKNSMIYSNRAYLPFDTNSTRIVDYGGAGTYILLIKLVEGKTYTISKRAGGRFRAGFTNTPTPALNVDNVITSRLPNNDTGTSMTFTVPTGSQYFVCNFYSADQTADVNVGYENMVNSIQIEEGNTATTYFPYQNLNGYDNYSIEEIKIGTFLGKPLYRKVLESTTYATSYQILANNIDKVINISGMIKRNDYDIWQFIPSRLDNAGFKAQFDNIQYSNSSATINVSFGTSWSTTFSIIIIILEYTKTTD